MLWLEMSRDEAHGGGSWAFGQSLWSPSRKTNGTKWAFWETLLHVEQMILCYTCGGKVIGLPSLPFRLQRLMALRPATGHPALALGAMLGASTVCRCAISLPLTILCCSGTFSEGEILNSEVRSEEHT